MTGDVRVTTQPYQGALNIVSCVRHVATTVGKPMLAAADHEGAYRSLPVREPNECFTLLPGNPKDCVWKHTVLPFGATSSVWAYLRVADVICFLAVVMLMLLSSHFVDDFYLCEPQEHAQQAFECFSRIHSSLGFKMKVESKITLLEVCWEIGPDSVRASAGSERVHKLLQWIKHQTPRLPYSHGSVQVRGQSSFRLSVGFRICG